MTHSNAPAQPERRTFLSWLTYLTGAAATAILSVPLVGFVLGALRKKKPDPVPLGHVKDFPEGQTRFVTFDNPLRQPWDGMTAHTGVYVCYLGKDKDKKDRFRVLAVNCAHLGCPVSWFPRSGLFMCPCHGGVYYENGDHASGPPPRGMFHCVSWVDKNGKLWIEAPHYPSLQDTLRKPAEKA
jgi:menaquinol-cytochrome c reductase iron-sulfur subunit